MRLISLLSILCISLTCKGSLTGLTVNIDAIIGNRDIAVALITSSGDTIVTGNRQQTDLASVMKFFQAAALSRCVDFDTLVTKQITVTDADLHRDTWSPLRASTNATPFTITPVELLDYSLNMSDNNAADILFDRFLKPENVDSIVRHDYGINDFSIGINEAGMHAEPSLSRLNKSTAVDAARLIYRFFTADTTASATLVKAIMARNSPFGRERIPAGMPNSSAKIFHKTGTGFMAPDSTVTPVNDLAFVSYPTGHGFACYALAVFTAGMPTTEATAAIADISRAVYSAVIVNESLTMNSSVNIPASRASAHGSASSSDGGISWGDIITQAVFDIVDSALSN